MKTQSFPVALFIGILIAAQLMADDWPQFRGPNRDGISKETGLLKQWPKDGPPLLWTFSAAGLGYSGPAVVGDRLYMSGGRGDSDVIFALDLKSLDGGKPKELWSAKIGPLFQWKGNNWNNGPNASPTVDGEFVFALGGAGDLLCVEAGSGKEVWRKNLPRDLLGEVNPIGGGAEDPTPLGWGYAWAPLVDGEQLICVPGGKQGLLAALDKKSGKVLWQSKEVTDQATYSSPIVAEIGGIRQYICVTNPGIVGIAAKDGKLLWRYLRDPAYDDVVIATPIFHDNYIFSSVGFTQGCDLIKLAPTGSEIKVEKVISDRSIQNRDGGTVLVGDHLYCYSEDSGWVCHEFKTGKPAWAERDKLGRGSLTYADGNLYCCSEKGGNVVLIEATPKGWTEKGRFKLPRESTQRRQLGGLWTHPVIANGRLYIRDQEFLYCFNLKP
ncbi:MAG TPA: PQQ-binding-like beta-propeller repeat protein [Gemmataceae bacterium]|jgi:outer membrane protein assembly factor BamB|nr:PQQ-binding-like beta-propeller repeat protein [Gemmataceae bacterium]